MLRQRPHRSLGTRKALMLSKAIAPNLHTVYLGICIPIAFAESEDLKSIVPGTPKGRLKRCGHDKFSKMLLHHVKYCIPNGSRHGH